MTSGGPRPTTRYPTAPSLVWATRTGADTTEAVPGASLGGAEPHALSAAASNAATRIKTLPRRAVTVATIRPGSRYGPGPTPPGLRMPRGFRICLHHYNKYMRIGNRRPWLILGICCMSLLIVGTDFDHRQRGAALDPAGPARLAERPAVDGRRLHTRDRQRSDGLRLARRPVRPAARISTGLAVFSLGSLLCALPRTRAR